jgi:endonuclease I
MFWLALVCLEPHISLATDTDYEPPATYYSAAEGLTGSALKTKLATIMTTGFVARSYGEIRYAYPIIDADPNHAGNILLIYTRASVSATWDGGATYNREHQWPCSLLGISTPSNSYKGVGSDFHMLRPCNPSINSSRNNSPFGSLTSSGTCGYKTSGFYYPGDADAGDVARAMFYAATRWNSYNNLTLVNGSPSTYQMGDLKALLHWHYIDVPDAFERRRNQAVYSNTLNPTYYQYNRNAYVDHPEYVWSVFVNQTNDTQLTVNTTSVDLGRVLVGASLSMTPVTITKTGVDGTYYSIKTSGDATSSVTGRYNAFPMDSGGAKTITVGLSSSTTTAGLKSGTITVDNLDITTGGGTNKGANDPDDVITVSAVVVDHASPSLSNSQTVSSLTLDFGTVEQNSDSPTMSFMIYNREQTAGYTAGLNLDSVAVSGDVDAFADTIRPFSNLSAGAGNTLTVTLNTTATGTFACDYALTCSDEHIPGSKAFPTFTIHVIATVAAQSVLAGDANGDGSVDVGDLGILAANYGGSNKNRSQGDFNWDGIVDVSDLGILAANYGTGSASGASFDADYATVFGTMTADEDADESTNSGLCSTSGLSLIVCMCLAAGFLTMKSIHLMSSPESASLGITFFYLS